MPVKQFTCPVCAEPFDVQPKDYNRAARRGYAKACSRSCESLRRRKYRSARLDAMPGAQYAAYRLRQDAPVMTAYARRYHEVHRERRNREATEWYYRNKARLAAEQAAVVPEYMARQTEVIVRIEALDAEIREGLERARLLAGPVLIACPMCAGSGCTRCEQLGRMPYAKAMSLMSKMSGRLPGE